MKWTKSSPTKPGWYWLKWNRVNQPCKVSLGTYNGVPNCMVVELDYFTASCLFKPIDTLNNALWAGPIPRPRGKEE